MYPRDVGLQLTDALGRGARGFSFFALFGHIAQPPGILIVSY
jgi:hypothetical protein